MLKAIIFDFDGVICESVDVKIEAFRKLFSGYPKDLDRIMDYHIRTGGISRYVKFKVIYQDILKKKLMPAASKELGKKFSDYVYRAIVKAPLVHGALPFLKNYYQQIAFFVASGTPQGEVRSIVKAKKLERFFKGVYGSPKSKYDIIQFILKKNKIEANSVIFVGDSINDYDGAHQARIKFIGRVREGHYNPFIPVKINGSIRDIVDLEKLLKAEKLITSHQK